MASRQGSRSKNTEANLLEQVRLLQIENDTLRSFIAEKGFGQTIQPPSANSDSNATEKRARHRSNSAAVSKKSPNIPTTPRTPFAGGKGCSCKGNCSTKVCGCVKKNIPCAEFCRCGDELCQNSEPDKENIGDANQAQLSKDGEESLIKLSKLTLGDKKGPKKTLAQLLPENQRLEKVIKPRSIFSPDVAENVFTFEDGDVEVELEDTAEKNGKGKETQEEPEKKSKKKNDKKTENPKAKNTGAAAKQAEPLHPALLNNTIADQSNPKATNKSKKNVEKRGKANTKQSDLADLKPIDEPALGHKHSEPETMKKGKKKTELKEITKASTEKQRNRIDSDVEDSQENEHSEPEPTNKMDKKADRKIGAAKNRNNRLNSNDSNKEDPQKNEHPEHEPVNKIKKKADTKTTGATKKKNNRMNSEEIDEEDSEENEPSVRKTSKPLIKNKKKVEDKRKATAVSQKRNDQTSDCEASQDSTNSEFESESPNKNLKVSKKVTNTRGAGKQSNRVDSQDEEEEEEEMASRENQHSDSDSEPKQRRKHRIHSEEMDEASQDTENSEYESEPPKKNKKSAKKATGDVKKRKNHVEFETDEDEDQEPSQDIEHSDSEPEPPHKNINVAKKTVPSGGVEKRKNRVDSEDDDEMTSQDNDNSDPDHEPAQGIRKKEENKGTMMPSRSSRIDRIHFEDIHDASEDIGNTESKAEPENDDAKHDAKKETQESSPGSNASSSLSYGTDTLVIPESDDFNPMKPRRQLSRSPLAPQKVQRPHRIDVSSVPLPIPVKEEPEEEVPPPAELAKDIVENWNEHLAMLVKCSKCGRTFHPHRIKIHEMHCKKI